MNQTDDSISSNEISNTSATIALTALVEKVFSATVLAPVLQQVGLTMGDQLKYFRIRNLIRLNEHLDRVLAEKNMKIEEIQKIPFSVGFPLLEKASYQDDEVLQRSWACLLASAMERNEASDAFSLDIMHIEILHQFSRLDCEVLEYIAENGVSGRDVESGNISVIPLDPLGIRSSFPSKPVHIVLEKLVSLGCAYRVLRAVLQTKGGDGYGAFATDIVVTLIGLNLYVAASGKKPSWYETPIDNDKD